MPELTGSTIGHYKLLEKLGEGGMGIVYKAHDTKLDRTVALKFLPQHLNSNEAEEARFIQEAKAAAALNHPNICAIYSFGEYDGRTFIEMEYIDGATLRQTVNSFPSRELPFAKAVTYALQIGEALQEAHSKGIVHRDVKADNIMVNGKGQIKVMDFGLAKLKGSLKLTRTSSTIGTLAYMAPEQIQGGEVDARSDIFSFGIVVFEMLTGRTPFKGEHEASIMYSIVNEDPELLSKYRTDLPDDLQRIIQRSLEKDPEDRYQSIADMVSELRRTQKQSTRVVRHPSDTATTQVTTAAAAATVAVPVGKRARMPFIAAAVILVIAAAIAGYFLLGRGETAIDSLAVMPFENVGGSSDQEYLSDGITESIINSLTKISSIRVAPRSTVFRYKGKEYDLADLGTKLKVTAVLTGKITHRGDAMDVQVDLINVKNESQIWGNSYQTNAAGIISLQDQITKDVSGKLGIAETEGLTKHSTENTAAYQLYLQGRYFWNKRNAVSIAHSIELFKQAIALDSTYALAFAGLADCYAVQSQYAGIPTRITIPLAQEAARRALALDNSLGEVHSTLAFCMESEWNYAEAEKEFKVAIQLSPKYPTAYHWYNILLVRLGRIDEAETIIKKAHDLDPTSTVIMLNVAIIPMLRHDFAAAVVGLKKALELDPGFAGGYSFLAYCEEWLNHPAEAKAAADKSLELSGRASEQLAVAGYVYARHGLRDKAREFLNENIERYHAGTGAAYNIAVICAGLDDREQMFKWLEQDVADRSTFTSTLKTTVIWDPYRADPRFKALLKTVGLDN